MLSLVIVFAIIGVLWLFGARYAAANWKWFRMVADQTEGKNGGLASRSPLGRTWLFAVASWRIIWLRNSLFRRASDADVEAARQIAAARLRAYVVALAAFVCVFVVVLLVVLTVLAVHAIVR